MADICNCTEIPCIRITREFNIVKNLAIGDAVPATSIFAGWLYGGISPTTGNPIFVSAADTKEMYWSEAMANAEKNNARLPTQEEMRTLQAAFASGARTLFNMRSELNFEYYWTMFKSNSGAWAMDITDGKQKKQTRAKSRLVREMS